MVVALLKVPTRNLSGETGDSRENDEDFRSASRNLNPERPKCERGVLTSQPRCHVTWCWEMVCRVTWGLKAEKQALRASTHTKQVWNLNSLVWSSQKSDAKDKIYTFTLQLHLKPNTDSQTEISKYKIKPCLKMTCLLDPQHQCEHINTHFTFGVSYNLHPEQHACTNNLQKGHMKTNWRLKSGGVLEEDSHTNAFIRQQEQQVSGWQGKTALQRSTSHLRAMSARTLRVRA